MRYSETKPGLTPKCVTRGKGRNALLLMLGVFALVSCLLGAGGSAGAFYDGVAETRESRSQVNPVNEPPAFGEIPDSTLYIIRPLQRIGTNLNDYTVGFIPVDDPDDGRGSLQFNVSVAGTPREVRRQAIFGVETTRQTTDGVALELLSGYVPFEFGQYGSGQYELEVSVWDGKDAAGDSDSAVDATMTLYLKYAKNIQPFFETGRNGLLLFDDDINNSDYELRDSIPAMNIDCDALTYSLAGEDAPDFSVNAATGQIELTNTTALQTTYSIEVNVSDGFDYAGVADATVDDSVDVVVTRTAGAFNAGSDHWRTAPDVELLTPAALGLNSLGSLIWTENDTAPELDVSAYIGADAQNVTVHPEFLVNVNKTAQGAWLAEIRPAVWDLLKNPFFPRLGRYYADRIGRLYMRAQRQCGTCWNGGGQRRPRIQREFPNGDNAHLRPRAGESRNRCV